MSNHEAKPKADGAESLSTAGFDGGPLDILDCLQDRPVVDGAAVPAKCVRLPLRECIWCEAKEGDHSAPICSGPDGRGHHFRETRFKTPNV